jgi:hypothetical protein
VRFSLIHVDDTETLTVVVPGGEKVAVMVPIDALPEFLPLLDEAIEALPEQCCAECGGPLPGAPRTVNGHAQGYPH